MSAQDTLRIKEPRGSLIDYVMANAVNPALFIHLPTAAETAALVAGTVKIGLEPVGEMSPHPEHFWVDIIERRGAGGFLGRVANDIQTGYGLRCGDHLIFCAHHIREIG